MFQTPRVLCTSTCTRSQCRCINNTAPALAIGRIARARHDQCLSAPHRELRSCGFGGSKTWKYRVVTPVCLAEKNPQFAKIDADSSAGLGSTSDEPFGPCAILLVGFGESEVDTIRGFLVDMGTDMVKLVTCTPEMLNGTLMAALQSSPSPYTPPTPEAQRTIFLSGLYSGEVLEVVEEYKRSGLPQTIFAAAVPKNANAVLSELCQEVMEDHQAMLERRRAEM